MSATITNHIVENELGLDSEGDMCFGRASVNDVIYEIGDLLKCDADFTSFGHGPKGHILEIATIKEDSLGHLWFWCHGVSGLKESDLTRLRDEYPGGNYGINDSERPNYIKVSIDWDT